MVQDVMGEVFAAFIFPNHLLSLTKTSVDMVYNMGGQFMEVRAPPTFARFPGFLALAD